MGGTPKTWYHGDVICSRLGIQWIVRHLILGKGECCGTQGMHKIPGSHSHSRSPLGGVFGTNEDVELIGGLSYCSL